MLVNIGPVKKKKAKVPSDSTKTSPKALKERNEEEDVGALLKQMLIGEEKDSTTRFASC